MKHGANIQKEGPVRTDSGDLDPGSLRKEIEGPKEAFTRKSLGVYTVPRAQPTT